MRDTQSVSEICFALLDSVLLPKSCAYVAGPLDSGRLFFEALAAGLPTDIRSVNEKRLTAFANQLRSRLTIPVFDPGPLRVNGWTGSDYSNFFIEVISRYVRELWFVDDWQYSFGATKEFRFCLLREIDCFDERGDVLTRNRGIQLIRDAIEQITGLGLNSDRLKLRLLDLTVDQVD